MFREIRLSGVRDVEAEFLGRVRRHGEMVGGCVRCVEIAWAGGGGTNRGAVER